MWYKERLKVETPSGCHLGQSADVILTIRVDGFNMCTGLIFFPEGDPEFGAHFLTVSEPPHATAEEDEEEEEVGMPEERDEEARPGASVEVQIGRKLREIGDQFHEEHLQLVRERRRRREGERFRVKQFCKFAWFFFVHCMPKKKSALGYFFTTAGVGFLTSVRDSLSCFQFQVVFGASEV
uniref:Uncharacterized protein n=1 Tax=Electrophorus electricus TaxID=8005 RepID=A0AAY5ELL9_ELEEL